MRRRHPKLGDIRIVRRFLIFPKRLNYETRWMEWAHIKQIREVVAFKRSGMDDISCWVTDSFVDKEDLDRERKCRHL